METKTFNQLELNTILQTAKNLFAQPHNILISNNFTYRLWSDPAVSGIILPGYNEPLDFMAIKDMIHPNDLYAEVDLDEQRYFIRFVDSSSVKTAVISFDEYPEEFDGFESFNDDDMISKLNEMEVSECLI